MFCSFFITMVKGPYKCKMGCGVCIATQSFNKLFISSRLFPSQPFYRHAHYFPLSSIFTSIFFTLVFIVNWNLEVRTNLITLIGAHQRYSIFSIPTLKWNGFNLRPATTSEFIRFCYELILIHQFEVGVKQFFFFLVECHSGYFLNLLNWFKKWFI